MVGRRGVPSGAARAKSNSSNSHTNNKKLPRKLQNPVTAGNNTLNEPDRKQRISDCERTRQQRVLDAFRHAFNDVLSSPTFTNTLQSVKQALYDRAFAKAFGEPEHLAVYAARWSPTRALCYASVLDGIKEHLETLWSSQLPVAPAQTGEPADDGTETRLADNLPLPQLKVLSVGGGAAELVALGAFLNQQQEQQQQQQQQASLSACITLLDSGPWAPVISQLTTALTTPPPLSKYASAASRLSNTALVPQAANFTSTFSQHDALSLGRTRLATLLGGTDPLLITILFTLNELFNSPNGIGKTTTFLLDLTCTVPLGSLLLVADSPGSYSETSVGKDPAKRYPMQWLLDRILLGTRREPVGGRRWRKLAAQDSAWFRLAGDELEYPIALENMRYQMHLYRAEDASLDEEEDEVDD